MLLDPHDGRTIATQQFDTWLLAARVLGEGEGAVVACGDLRGEVTFLSVPALDPIRTVSLGGRLRSRIVFAPTMPSRWGAGREASFDQEPTVLVGDRRGFVHLLALPDPLNEEDTR
jgi:hypothetical protein